MNATSEPGDSAGPATPPHDLEAYTERLTAERPLWRRALNTQAPFRWNIRRLVTTPVLDVGCGVGRNLLHLDGAGVGVDSNDHSVAVARDRGLEVYTAEEFRQLPQTNGRTFPTLLFAHVLEHMSLEEASGLVAAYLPYVEEGGKVVIIVPQEAGFATDDTHVHMVQPDDLRAIAASNGLVLAQLRSFPLPAVAGRFLRYNETIAVMRTATASPDR